MILSGCEFESDRVRRRQGEGLRGGEDGSWREGGEYEREKRRRGF